ncbi:glycosyltransferase family 2 protein [Sphingomonas sp. CCH5-D11]|jgi:glycosyltransferase involved in cell wall biosynthesis|uniref:glycosyltransferase family 2 protein n=1 Tax=Sphingomonas sp. CCH5-D11 TaxID=1768786 RepID=UPI000A5F1CDE|nr:glycosyltransferase family 2 protein [Sphingomonas sp. CCH5-D11]
MTKMHSPGTLRPPPEPDFSVVVPLYNEEENVALLHRAVTDALAQDPRTFELVLVDDGSRDGTLARAAALVATDERVRVVEFARNYGQTAAMAAGIHHARGRVIVTMDGDLQNDPRDIPAMLDLLEQGHDMVAGWRRKRQDEGKRMFVSKVANRIINGLLGVSVRDSGCSLKCYRRELIQSLPFYGEMHRFIPALSQMAGARIKQVEVRHHPRRFGTSKYGFSRIYKVALDIVSIRFLLRYSQRPRTWMLRPTLAALLLGLAILLLVEIERPGVIVGWSIVLLFAQLALFMGAWSMLGYFLSVTEPRVSQFSALAAKLYGYRKPPVREVP